MTALDQDVLVEIADGVATVSLNRPDKLNAVTPEMAARIASRLRGADDDPDVRFAASSASFTTSFARLGLVAEYGLAWLLPRLIGHPAAADLLLSGRSVDAEEAVRLGLVSAVLPPDDLLPHATAYARELARRCSPRSIAIIKQQLRDDAQGDQASAFSRSLSLMVESFDAPDLAEAINAASRNRRPAFPPLEQG